MKITDKLKKLPFLLPAIVFTLFYGGLALAGITTIHPIVFVWIFLLWLAGILLSKAMFWGGLFGLIPAGYFIYMGTQETGQIISETPIGIIVLLYFAVCTYYVYRMAQKNKL